MVTEVAAKIADLLIGLKQNEVDNILNEVPEITKRKRYEILFNEQIDHLEGLGLDELDENSLNKFKKRKDEVVAKALEMKIPDDHYPFMPHIKGELDWLARRVIYNGSSVKVDIELKDVQDVIVVFEPSYSYTFDIERGRATSGLDCPAAEKLISDMGRSPLMLEELMLLYILTADTIPLACLNALGSRHKSSRDELLVPDLYPEHSEMIMGALIPTISSSGRGSPSCVFRG